MYILLLHWFSSTLLLLFRRTLSAEAQQRSANVVFRSIEENCQIFLRFPFWKRQPASKTFPSSFLCATACSTTLTRTHHNRGGQGDFALLLNFSWENLAAFRIFACLGSSRCSLISIPNLFYTHQESFTTVHTASVTIFLNSGPTPAIVVTFGVVVGSSARVTQSDVCDVTFPKTDCARRSPARLSRAHFFRGASFALSVPHWRR